MELLMIQTSWLIGLITGITASFVLSIILKEE